MQIEVWLETAEKLATFRWFFSSFDKSYLIKILSVDLSKKVKCRFLQNDLHDTGK